MLTEFALLTALTLTDDEREVLRNKVNGWVKSILPKLKRESSRTEKCRLIASVERHEFRYNYNAIKWRFFKFVGNKGILFDEKKRQLEDSRTGRPFGEFEATSFQKKIL